MRLDDAVSAATGAAVLSGRDVVAVGRNHDRRLAGATSVHAEMDALRKVPPRRRASTSLRMVVVRVSSSGALAQSRPCDACMRALRRFRGMRSVAYSCSTGGVVIEALG
jgi:tRNA(Arg) A34 adenosine deaminase TadA